MDEDNNNDSLEDEKLTTLEKTIIEAIKDGGIDKYLKNAQTIRKEANERFDKIFPKILIAVGIFYFSIYYLVIDGRMSSDVLVAFVSTIMGVIGTLFIQSRRIL